MQGLVTLLVGTALFIIIVAVVVRLRERLVGRTNDPRSGLRFMEEEWKREWRRWAGGVLGVVVLVAGGYKFPTTGGRLRPANKRTYFSPTVEIPLSDAATAVVTYEVTYGPVNGTPRYRRTHKIAILLADMALPQQRGSNNWHELEEETDVVVSPAPR